MTAAQQIGLSSRYPSKKPSAAEAELSFLTVNSAGYWITITAIPKDKAKLCI